MGRQSTLEIPWVPKYKILSGLIKFFGEKHAHRALQKLKTHSLPQTLKKQFCFLTQTFIYSEKDPSLDSKLWIRSQFGGLRCTYFHRRKAFWKSSTASHEVVMLVPQNSLLKKMDNICLVLSRFCPINLDPCHSIEEKKATDRNIDFYTGNISNRL